ncbi:hypothetical protein M5689_022950 [Euphorbia peplus]|nr:hypothetical protein M5689_022950 [Euphorbia peplus]
MEQRVYGKEDRVPPEHKDMKILVHNQVRKIRQESTKIVDFSPEKPEVSFFRPVLREITGSRHLSPSPLGLAAGRAVS